MWTTNGCTTRSQRRGGAPDRKTRRSRRPKGGWPPTSKRWKPISSARDAPGHDLIPSPAPSDAGGASHPAGQRSGHATAPQSRAGANARQAGALEAADSDAGAPQPRHVPAHRARPRRAAGRRRGRRGARRHRSVSARPTGARLAAPARRSSACASARAAPPPPPPPPPPAPPRPGISERLTQFTGAAELHGTVGSTLAQPLVLEVRDTAGAPFVGQPVTITTSSGGGTGRPSAAESDTSGLVRVRVTLGERAGPTTITASVGTLTRTVLVRADPGPPEALVVERGDTPVVGSLTLRSRDTVVLRVVARDRYGNRTAPDKFGATTTARAIALTATATDAAGSVPLVPRRSGVGELTLSGSGLRARLPVDVVLPTTSAGAWGLGARTAWLGANHPWIGLAGVTGIKGADFSIFGRRTVVAGLSLALGSTAGSLNADQTTRAVSLQLLEGYGSAEFALVPGGTVSPVLSLGAGGYRLKSGDHGRTVDHTNLFWSGGVGADVVVTASVIVELRVERQWMREPNQGHGATLWPLSAGVRVGL